ncbi:hypothetical protein BK816_08465 [Boudabousia tangfeifanii]|uniref:Uncharacterized protein n=1 Tax=Boudabousia tangfeifanii TaxID=1912795 RepID=A0A1D9MLZ4_9ACTO|nr:hypothetical protein [Boudabousia tangfeifanii]AOZ73305.1 hypothetical protein BK816_08465 [Boudabousia tangfeifanii]
MTQKKLAAIISSIGGLSLFIATILYYFVDRESWFFLFFVPAIILLIAGYYLKPKTEPKTLDELYPLDDIPNPTAEEIKEYRRRHTEANIAQATLALKREKSRKQQEAKKQTSVKPPLSEDGSRLN